MDHRRWHDVHTQTVDTHHRRSFAILHREGVLVLLVVATTVRDEPLDLVRAVWQFWRHIRVLLLLGVPTYAGRFVVANHCLLDRKAILLVGWNQTLVERAGSTTREVRVARIVVLDIVPAQTSDASVH